jgi:hypothetical protein
MNERKVWDPMELTDAELDAVAGGQAEADSAITDVLFAIATIADAGQVVLDIVELKVHKDQPQSAPLTVPAAVIALRLQTPGR